MKALILLAAAVGALLSGCENCCFKGGGGNSCGQSTVFPIASGTYRGDDDGDCPRDGGTPDPGVICEHFISVDVDAATVTERFRLDGADHVVRYRVTRSEQTQL